MARKKSNNFIEIFKIFFSCIYKYFQYFDQTSKALIIPIFGQIVSLSVILFIAYFYNQNVGNIINFFHFFADDTKLFFVYIIILIPFFYLFLKCFYNYILMFSSLNLLFYTNANKKNIKNIDFKTNNDVIQRKMFSYVVLLFIVSFLFIPPLIIVTPFICLSFQVFALEGNISPLRAIIRSIDMVKSNIIPSLILIALCYLLTYLYLPSLFIWVSEKTSVYYFIMGCFEKIANQLPVDISNLPISDLGAITDYINDLISPVSIARNFTEGLLSFIVIGFTLPFRCCCFTELYRLYDSQKIKENSKMTDEIVKRATSKKYHN